MAAPRFWLASSSNRPRCKAVVRSLVAARTGEASRQSAAASRQELPPFRNSVIIFIRVLFYSFRSQFDGFPANQLSPFCKIGVPADHARPANSPGRKQGGTDALPLPKRPPSGYGTHSQQQAGCGRVAPAVLRRSTGDVTMGLRWSYDGVTKELRRDSVFFPSLTGRVYSRHHARS